ncbi:Hypothetical predicted protein [Pelobates cultripes]|uniref:Uncharacterized protein n=1 Tax=Pelobates cultripes TaxID=61616 RepID=A0AAD1RY74_PELCU|nr:Hypothetical predicted protein [Pelobates cultripes]
MKIRGIPDDILVPKRRRAPASASRDIVVKFRTGTDKAAILATLKGKTPYAFENTALTFNADHSGDPLKWRWSLKPFTALLRKSGIEYIRHPATHQGLCKSNLTYKVTDLQGAEALLLTLALLEDSLTPSRHPENSTMAHLWDPERITPFVPQGRKTEVYVATTS